MAPERGEDLEKYYNLSVDELTCPDNGKGVEKWFDQLVSRQLEGVNLGFRPKNPIGLSLSLREQWLVKVWAAYLKEFSLAVEPEIAGVIVVGRGEKHTSSGRYYQDKF